MTIGKTKSTGKGLGTLLPGYTLAKDKDYFECGLDRIEANPDQPRKMLSDRALSELAESIREQGVLLPLVVKKKPGEGEKVSYQIVAGERRWRAAKLAGLSKVPVIVKEVSSKEQLELALVENIQRQDLNPLEEAEAYLRLAEEFSMNQEEIARRVGKERSTVANALRLNKLPDFAKEDLVNARLSTGHARVLLSLSETHLIKEARDEVIKKGLNVRQTEALVKNKKRESRAGEKSDGKRRDKKSAAIPDSYCSSITTCLVNHFGTNVRITQNGTRGKLEIDYFSPDDLDRVVAMLIPLSPKGGAQ